MMMILMMMMIMTRMMVMMMMLMIYLGGLRKNFLLFNISPCDSVPLRCNDEWVGW